MVRLLREAYGIRGNFLCGSGGVECIFFWGLKEGLVKGRREDMRENRE
jgi:hypothetical protein